MIRSGMTPKSRIDLISSLLAQSKPAPSRASTDRTPGSLLHLTAALIERAILVSKGSLRDGLSCS